MSSRKTLARVAVAVVGIATLAGVIYVMANGLGLQDSLDFGAGSYYYADIPDFDKYLKWDAYKTNIPYWVYAILFIAWGIIMYLVWKWIDRRK